MSSALFGQAPGGAGRPNVLLIVVDDLNTDIGCMDGGGKTPNIDRLARKGVLFTDAHSNSPLCNPSRTSFLTGLLPPNSGVRDNSVFFRDVPGNEDVVTLPGHFRDHGYRVIGAGKVFHSGWKNNQLHPSFRLLDYERSWEDYAEIPMGLPHIVAPEVKWHGGEVTTSYGKSFWWGQTKGRTQHYSDFLNAHYAAGVLGEPQDRPFFLACGIFRPHLPFVVPSKYFDHYPLEDIEWPAGINGQDVEDLPAYGRHFANRTGLMPALLKDERWKHAIQAYRASTTFADRAVGVVLNALDEGPHRDNTIVVLISDHGFHLGEKNHWTKSTFWDRATRVPMIVAGPGVRPGTSVRTVSLVDLFPTLNALCGLPAIDRHDGQNLTHLLDDPAAEHRSVARVFHRYENHEAIIDEGFRYIRYADGGEELYDREVDPHDWHNLAVDQAYAAHLDRYRGQLFFVVEGR